eukprot:scaffold22615_cov97-Cylindrotheca_fusiformis.AAC.5
MWTDGNQHNCASTTSSSGSSISSMSSNSATSPPRIHWSKPVGESHWKPTPPRPPPHKRQQPQQKRVRFAMADTTTCNIPSPRRVVGDTWYSGYEYSFFILNWKYFPNEPRETRNWWETIFFKNNNKQGGEEELECMEDYQSFLPGAHKDRQKIRRALLYSLHTLNGGNSSEQHPHDSMAAISVSLTKRDRHQALKCAALNAKEVQAYQELPVVQQQQRNSKNHPNNDPTSFIAEYFDSIFNDWNPINVWIASVCDQTNTENNKTT